MYHFLFKTVHYCYNPFELPTLVGIAIDQCYVFNANDTRMLLESVVFRCSNSDTASVFSFRVVK